MTNDVKDLDKELAQLEAAIAEPGLDATDQVKLRERHALVSAKLADAERSAPYAEDDTEALRAMRETGELERENVRLELDAAITNRGERSVLARQLRTQLFDIDQRESALRVELETRAFADATRELGRRRAATVAEQEIRAQDAEALAGLDDWRRGKAEEALRSSFDDRVAKHAETVESRLWQEGEADAGRTLLLGVLGGPDGDMPVARPLRELLAEAETEQEIADE